MCVIYVILYNDVLWHGVANRCKENHHIELTPFKENCRVTIRFAMVLRKNVGLGPLVLDIFKDTLKIERQYQAIDSE